jgi:hypothetical protein
MNCNDHQWPVGGKNDAHVVPVGLAGASRSARRVGVDALRSGDDPLDVAHAHAERPQVVAGVASEPELAAVRHAVTR